MPPAARILDTHVCPMVTGVVPHVGGPVALGCFTVLVGGMPAARVGDICTCVGPPDTIAKGSASVLIGGMSAARLGDLTAHGGSIVAGCPTVLIGDAASRTGGSGGGAAGGSSAPGSGPAGGSGDSKRNTAADPGPAARAFLNAAKSGAALVCKGPCAACGQA